MRGPSRQEIIEWVFEAEEKLPADMMKNSFRECALSVSLDGTEDDQIMCIKHGPCQNLLHRLQTSQLDNEEDFQKDVSSRLHQTGSMVFLE